MGAEATLTARFRRWSAVFSWGCGLATAAGVHALLDVPIRAQLPPEPVRVAVRASAPAARAAPDTGATLPLVAERLPARPRKATPPPPAAPPAGELPQASLPVSPGVALDLPQPGFAPAAETPPELLTPPPQPAEDAFASQYDDAPHRDVVVVAMLVGFEGDVLDTKLVIPSRFALRDLGLLMAARQQKVTSLQPPLAPGEVRWLEIRLVYSAPPAHVEGPIP